MVPENLQQVYVASRPGLKREHESKCSGSARSTQPYRKLTANALAEALANGDLTEYEVSRRRINRPPEMMSRLLPAIENHAWLRRRGLAALGKEPDLFERLLALHAGTFSPPT